MEIWITIVLCIVSKFSREISVMECRDQGPELSQIEVKT